MRWSIGLNFLFAGCIVGACSGGGADSTFRPVATSDPNRDLPPLLSDPASGNPEDFASTAEYGGNRGLGLINAAEGYAQISGRPGGEGVRVAVIDTGIAVNHPEFSNAQLFAFTARDGNDDPGDLDGHGTHVAGTIGARRDGVGMHGVAYKADLVGIKVFRTNDPVATNQGLPVLSFSSDLALGILSAAGITRSVVRTDQFGRPVQVVNDFGEVEDVVDSSNGAAEASVMNMSLGASDPGFVIFGAMVDAAERGKIMVAALGNSARVGPEAAPGLYMDDPRLRGLGVGVAALDRSGQRLADFSNSCGGLQNCISAPGEAILAPHLSRGQFVLTELDGTSMASPHVAGAAAVAIAAFPGVSPQSIVNRMFRTADDLGAPGRDPLYGWGRLNMERLLAPEGVLVAPTTASVAGGGVRLSSLSATAGPGMDFSALAADAQTVVLDEAGFPFSASLENSLVNAPSRLSLSSYFFDDATVWRATGVGGVLSASAFRADAEAPGRSYGPSRRDEAAFASGVVSFDIGGGLSFSAATGVDQPLADSAGHARLIAASPLGETAEALPFTGSGEAFAVGVALSDKLSLEIGLHSGDGVGDTESVATGLRYSIDAFSAHGRVGVVREDGAIAGASLGGFGAGAESMTRFATIGGEARLHPAVTFGLSYTRALVEGGGGDMVQIGAHESDAASASLTFMAPLRTRDRLHVVGLLPFAARDGAATLRTATGRTEAGAVSHAERSASLAPAAREKSLQVIYETRVGDAVAVDLAGFGRLDADNRRGETDFGAAARLRLDF